MSNVRQEQKHLSKIRGNLYFYCFKAVSKDWFPCVTVTSPAGFLEIPCLVEVAEFRGAIVNSQKS